MFGTTTNTYKINTNFNNVEFNVSTKACLKVIRNNPKGINLTDIVRTLHPDFDFNPVSYTHLTLPTNREV